MAGKILKVDISMPAEETVLAVSSVLESGDTVLYPSDTVYGIMADSSNPQAVKAVAEIKGYSEIRPFIVLVESVARALELTSEKSKELIMKKYWPGPVTLVLPASDAVHPWLLSDTGTVALRIPSDPLSMKILKYTSLELITTSANRKGESFPLSTDSINPEVLKSASLILDGGPLPDRKPSRIIDITGEKPIERRS